MKKFEIKNRFSGNVIFSVETENLKLAVEAAIKSNADLSDADLRYANLRSADLRSANLSSANLRYADLRSADLRYANLSDANLSDADLSYANLSYANLSYANLRDADLRYADLSYANLRYANLRSANLSSANLSSANLRSADLRSADGINPNRCTPLLMLNDQPGKIRAYKLVAKNNEGPFQGGIKYEIGKTYSVDDANVDVGTQCAAGINLATLDWCIKEWHEGYRILIAEFEAKDIAAIPTATDGKFRCHKVKIVGEKDLKEIGLVKEPP